MAYSYSGWANEFASVAEKKEKPGLGTRNEPLESNTPTFTQTVVQNFNDTRQDDTPLESNSIVTVPVKPSNLMGNERTNKYMEEQRFSQTQKTKLLEGIIRTNNPNDYGLMSFLANSANTDSVVYDSSGGVTSVTKTPKKEYNSTFFNPVLGYTLTKKTDQSLIDDWAYIYQVETGDVSEEFYNSSTPTLSEKEYQNIFNDWDGGGSTTESKEDRLRRIDLNIKTEGTSIKSIIETLIDQTLEYQKTFGNTTGFSDTTENILELFGYTFDDYDGSVSADDYEGDAAKKAAEGIIGSLISETPVLKNFSFDLGKKPTSASVLQKISKHLGALVPDYKDNAAEEKMAFIPSFSDSVIGYDQVTDIGDFNFTAKASDIIDNQGSKYQFSYTGPLVNAVKNEYGLNVSAKKGYDFGGGFTGDFTLDKYKGFGVKGKIERNDLFGIDNLSGKVNFAVNDYGTTWGDGYYRATDPAAGLKFTKSIYEKNTFGPNVIDYGAPTSVSDLNQAYRSAGLGTANYTKRSLPALKLGEIETTSSLDFTGYADAKKQTASGIFDYRYQTPNTNTNFGLRYDSGKGPSLEAGFSGKFNSNPATWFKR